MFLNATKFQEEKNFLFRFSIFYFKKLNILEEWIYLLNDIQDVFIALKDYQLH